MSNQLVITSGAKVRNLNGVITGTTGVLNSLPINAANGIPQLDSSGKILVSQLPNSVMEFLGVWNASTNTPTLANGTGNAGDVYLCNVAGTVNFGAGPITFAVGDYAVYTGSVWARSSGATGTVTSVAVTESVAALNITGSPITTSGTINIGFAGTSAQYVAGDGSLITFPSLTGFVPYTGATSDVNLGLKNLYVNNVFDGFSSVVASGTQIVLTVASVPNYLITGSGGQTIKLPDATTLPNGAVYIFNNNQSSGAINVNNNSNTLVVSIPSGGYCVLELTDNSIAAGSWDRHFQAPSNVSWSTNTLDYAGSITSATWNGNVVAINRGGTGASTAGTALSNLGGVPTTRTLSINGTTYDLSADRSWTITAGVSSVTATSPLFSSGGSTPNLTIQVANTSQNGYLSSTDWNTFNNKQNALGYVPVGGSGSINYISKFTGSTTISQSGIYEGVTNYVSIGNTNTTYNLDVSGTSRFTNTLLAASILTNTSAGITIGVDGSSNGGALKFTQNTSVSVGGPTESSFSTYGNSKYYFYAGISSGVYKAFYLDNGLLTNNTIRTYQMPDASGTLALTSQIPSLTGYVTGTGTSGQVTYFNGTSSVTGSNNFFWDNTNGWLGIGTNTPSAGVTSYSTTAATQFKSAGVAPAMTFSNTLTSPTLAAVFGLATASGQFVTGTASGDFAIANQSSTPGAIVFGTGTAEKMRMTSAGTFSIGNTNSTYTLDVTGTGRFTSTLNTGGAITANIGSYNPSFIAIGSASGNGQIQLSGSSNYSIGAGTDFGGMGFYVGGAYRTYILNNGNVGIGTSSPDAIFHVAKSNAGGLGGQIVIDNFAGDTVGSTAELSFLTTGGASGSGIRNGRIQVVCDNASTGASNMQFFTWNGSSDAERMRITSGGVLCVARSSAPSSGYSAVFGGNGTQDAIAIFVNNNGNNAINFFNGSGTYVASISVNATTVVYGTVSDYRLKDDFKEIKGLEKLSKIKVYDFKMKSNNERMDGVIAHELQEIIPYAVTGKKDDKYKDGTDKIQQVDYSKIVPTLVKAIQELKAEIDELKNK